MQNETLDYKLRKYLAHATLLSVTGFLVGRINFCSGIFLITHLQTLIDTIPSELFLLMENF